MTSPVNVLIVEPNIYFALGFTQAIVEHFNHLRVNWVFSRTLAAKDYADVIFFSSEQKGAQRRYLTQRQTCPQHQRIFMFKQTPGLFDKTQYQDLDGIFYRRQSLDSAMQIMTRTLDTLPLLHPQKRNPVSLASSSPQLTPREREILGYLADGLRACEISRALHISQKTVSAHKHNAMVKLGINRSPDLNYWLLRNVIGQLAAHWPPTECPTTSRWTLPASEPPLISIA
ncbi:helix-turn-helix domain-containing protein [Serratia sp. NA_112.1]|uniref:helix-turn-helix domain-containing protein n=1 Tax=Serratia sp. NA_112.1 TaxID=3415665 RepID=UPI004046BDE3